MKLRNACGVKIANSSQVLLTHSRNPKFSVKTAAFLGIGDGNKKVDLNVNDVTLCCSLFFVRSSLNKDYSRKRFDGKILMSFSPAESTSDQEPK